MLACSYGLSMYESSVTENTRDNLNKAMFGEPMHECMKNTFNLESIADENDQLFVKLKNKLTLYTVLFIIMQLGILYLGSALIVRGFNKKLQKIQAKRTPEFLN